MPKNGLTVIKKKWWDLNGLHHIFYKGIADMAWAMTQVGKGQNING